MTAIEWLGTYAGWFRGVPEDEVPPEARKDFDSVSEICVPALIKSLADQDPDARAVGAEALGQFARQPSRAIPALTKLLVDEAFQARMSALDGLRQFGTEAKAAVPALVAFIKATSDPSEREAGLTCLKAIVAGVGSQYRELALDIP
jgi:HEAT repeat protein